MEVMYADINRLPQGSLEKYSIDLELGGDNDFELQMNVRNHCMSAGCIWYVENEEYGGIVDDVKVDTFWNQILNRRTRSFMWNIRGVTEYESFSFIMEPTHFNMSKLNNPSQLDPEDIKVVLSLHNDSYRTNSNIYNHVEEKQSLLNTI